MLALSRPVGTDSPRDTACETFVELVVDGGDRHGFGHIGRCLALWEELGARAAFRVGNADLVDFLSALGVRTVDEDRAPIVVLDRAAPVAMGEVRALRAAGRRAVLLDDRGPARMAVDVVVDPPTAATWPVAAGLRLAGFEHVLLRREVREAAGGSARRGGLLLAMGGSDPSGLTPVLAETLCAVGIEVTVALGPGYRGPVPRASTLLRDATEFIDVLAGVDLFVAGYGHSLLEAAYLGTPAIAAVYMPEHLVHARAFCRAGTALMFDVTAASGRTLLADGARRLLADVKQRAKMTARGRELLDGRGAERIVRVLKGLA